MDLEGPFDTLNITDGNGQLLATVTNPVYSPVSSSQLLVVVQEGTQPMTLVFSTDASFRQQGFIMSYVAEAAASADTSRPYNVSFGLHLNGGRMTALLRWSQMQLMHFKSCRVNKLLTADGHPCGRGVRFHT